MSVATNGNPRERDALSGPVRAPDALHAVTDTATMTTSGGFEAARQQVERLISELMRTGALDEGSADVLDRLIDSWQAQQANRINAYFLDRRRDVLQELSRAEEGLRQALFERDEAQNELTSLRTAAVQLASRQMHRQTRVLVDGDSPAATAAPRSGAAS
jgi:predicted negative regulator of RcsB-dependent stress response